MRCKLNILKNNKILDVCLEESMSFKDNLKYLGLSEYLIYDPKNMLFPDTGLVIGDYHYDEYYLFYLL